MISSHFLNKRPLIDDEIPRFRSLKIPNEAEAMQIFGANEESEVPVVVEAVAHSESEENNSVELLMQTASATELGHEGLAIQELIGSMAHYSAFNQPRTKRSNWDIVYAFVKKSNGGGNAFCVLVQSSNTLPPALEERCLRWVGQFRQELEEFSEEYFAMEAAARRSSLLKKDIKLSEESSVPITLNIGKNQCLTVLRSSPMFFHWVAIILQPSEQQQISRKRFLNFTISISSRVYNRKAKDLYHQNVEKNKV